ncbi:MAG: polysaccharide deacetylase family protein [Eubacteriales bacterium]|jgi:peptidoglycan/xylan/chitin deacetylase (PgdA/CDA1 family)
MDLVSEIFIYFLFVYAFMPTILARIFHIGTFFQGSQNKNKVFITFDDGPDSVYTPRILDILKETQTKACFFVLGEKARAHPEILQRIQAEGHEIENHGYNHQFPWLLGPLGTKRDIMETSSIIAEITGKPPRFYRPPWGVLNLFSWFFLKGQQIVLWSFMSWDWTRRTTISSIAEQVLPRIKNGSVLIFHDSDKTPGSAPKSPEVVIRILPAIIREIENRGLQAAALSELVPVQRQKLFYIFFEKWDRILIRLMGAKDLYDKGRPTVLRIAMCKYKGKQLPLPDGTLLKKGDLVVDLHLNNSFFKRFGEKNELLMLGLLAKNKILQDLPAVAEWIAANPRCDEIKAITGLTILNRGSQQIGFHNFDLPPLRSFLIKLYEGMLLVMFHPAGYRRIARHKKKLIPKLLVMSKKELFRKYLT